MLYEWLMVGVGLVLTFGTGLFVATEFALVNLDRNDLEARAERGEAGLGRTINALKITSTHLSGAQLGITLTTLLTGFTFEPAVSSLLETPLGGLGLGEGMVNAIGSVLGIAVATLFSMVIGELVPKNFALALPVATARAVVPFQTFFTAVFRPLISLCNNTANAVVRALGVEPKEELSGARSAEELSSLVRRSAMEGIMDADHATLLNRTLRFSDHSAADVMTPRVRMAKVRSTDTAADLLRLSQTSGFSRFPVIGDDSDDVVGVTHIKWAFALEPDDRLTTAAQDLMVEPLRVPESMGVDGLLGLLRRGDLQMGIVTDEYGGTAGLVTLEDLVEELVGELEDEYDRARPRLVRSGDDITFDAALRPDELLEMVGVRVPDDRDYDTIGGFVTDELDRLPEEGDEVFIDQGTLRVERVDGTRADRLRFIPTPVEDDLAATEPDDARGGSDE